MNGAATETDGGEKVTEVNKFPVEFAFGGGTGGTIGVQWIDCVHHSDYLALHAQLTAAEERIREVTAELQKAKQAFEDLRIADQASLTETLAAALEQQLRADKAESERKELREQVKHHESGRTCWGMEDTWPAGWMALDDNDLRCTTEYGESCKCFRCQWVRYELCRREQMIRICEQRDEARALAEWKPISEDSLPGRGDEAMTLPTDAHGALVIPCGFDARDGDAPRYIMAGFTHYRPINPPASVVPEVSEK